MTDEKLKRTARGAGVPQWKIAAELKISEPTLTRWLRVPLSGEQEKAFLDAIKKLSQEVD